MADKEKNKIVVLEPTTDTVEQLLEAVQKKGQAEIERVSSSAEVAQLVAMYQPCMMVLCLTANSQLPDHVSLLRKLEGSLKKGLIKTMYVSTMKNSQVSNVITSMGVTDFIQEPVPVRTMQFKANLQLKAVETVRKVQQAKKASEEKIVFKKSDAAAQNGANAGNGTANAKMKPALQLQEDSFLFKNSGVKKVGKKFVVELEGPAPETGEWKPHEDKGNAQSSWRWVPKEDENGKPLDDRGDGWVHNGDKPEFQESTGKWKLASEKPELAFQKNGQKIAKKISTDDAGEVQVAADSPAAAENVQRNRELAQAKRARAAGKAPREKAAPEEKAAKPEAETAAPDDKPEEEKEESAAQKALRRVAREKAKRQEAEEAAAAEGATEAAVDDAVVTAAPGGEEAPGAETILGKKERDKPAKAPVSPLEFLQRKKDARNAPPAAVSEEKSPEAHDEQKAMLGVKKREKKREAEEAPLLGGEDASKPKKSATDKSLDLLARMKQRLGKEGGAAGEESADETIEAAADGATEGDAAGEGDPARTGVARKARDKAGREQAAAESSAPDAPENDAPPAPQLGVKARDKTKARRDIMDEIQARLNSPLPDQLPPEEEAHLREKFKLQNRPDVTPKDLARKERLDSIKRLKERLENLDTAPVEEAADSTPEHNVHDLVDVRENTQSQQGALREEDQQSRMRAFDSEEAAPGEEETESLRKKKRTEKAEQGADLYEDKANYLPAAAIHPPGGAWESTGAYYVYLLSDTRYRGFERLEDLLPLWIFEGSGVPELLDRTQQWRFNGPLPREAKALTEVPREVREFLLGLREQLKKSAGEDAADDPEKAAEAERVAREDAAAAEATAEERAREKPATQADGLEEAFSKKRKDEGSAAADALARLKGKLGDADGEGGDDFTSSAEAAGDELSATGGAAEERKRKRAEGDEAADELNATAKKIVNDDETDANPSGGSPRDRKAAADQEAAPDAARDGKKANDLQSKLDSLKSRLGGDDATADAESAEAAAAAAELGLTDDAEAEQSDAAETEAVNLAEERKARREATAADESAAAEDKAERSDVSADLSAEAERAGTGQESSYTASTMEKLKAGSPAFEKFLERRRKKHAEGASAETARAGEKSAADLAAAAKGNAYLGIYVALSNSFGAGAHRDKALSRVLKAIALSFGRCEIAYVHQPDEDGQYLVEQAAGAALETGSRVNLADGFAAPVRAPKGEEILGYLFLVPSEDRSSFEAQEEAAALKAAELLWPLLSRAQSTDVRGKAA